VRDLEKNDAARVPESAKDEDYAERQEKFPHGFLLGPRRRGVQQMGAGRAETERLEDFHREFGRMDLRELESSRAGLSQP